MTQYIDKDAVVAEIERLIFVCHSVLWDKDASKSAKTVYEARKVAYNNILSFINTLEVKDPYEQCVQYDSIKTGIQAHAETYSFNIKSELFNQLTKEQQKLWRKEIEQACISGGYSGLGLAKDPRYEENLEVKEVDLEKEYKDFVEKDPVYNKLVNNIVGKAIAKRFFELGFKLQKSKGGNVL